jgi:hypothetical protein
MIFLLLTEPGLNNGKDLSSDGTEIPFNAISSFASESDVINESRSGGKSDASGKYMHPAFHIPRIAAGNSIDDRGVNTATTDPTSSWWDKISEEIA